MLFTKRVASAALLAGVLIASPAGTAHADDAPIPSDSDTSLRVRHYETVEAELLAADTHHLTHDQRTQRERVIRELRAYRTSADFGINTAFPGERRPYFVDDDGRRCAVAHLLHRWGEDDLVSDVARSKNFAYVSDLATSRELAEWLDGVGLSLREAARIQAPTVVPTEPEPNPNSIDLNDVTNPESAPTGRPAGVTTGGGDAKTPTTGSGVTRRTPRTGAGAAGADSWWMWWEFNKLSFLDANRLQIAGAVTGTETPETAQNAGIEARRRSALTTAIKDMEHPDARVRAAAAIAAGRIGGAAAAPALMRLLEDSQQQVRDAAILALGATGAPDATAALVTIATQGSHLKRGGDLSPFARGNALLALGIARRAGAPDALATTIASIVDETKRRDAEQVRAGGMLFRRLATAAPLESEALALATDRNAADSARALAVEDLPGADDARLSALQKALAGRELELRRSAAIALGEVRHDLVLPRLQTAYELEREPLTRGFLLLAIGQQGGGTARTFLAKEMREGPAQLRPWATLALGVLSREHDDSTARIILRNAELPKAQLGALYLARGLARDGESVTSLATAMKESGAPRTRAHAASALGLVGGHSARFELLAAHPQEKSRLVRSAIAVSLGSLGAAEDADVLTASMPDAEDPAYQGTLAVALGLHGSVEALDGVERTLAAKYAAPAVRATALQALGILLDRRGPMVLPEVSSDTNYTVLPGWVTAALQTGL